MRLHTRLERLEADTKRAVLARSLEVVARAWDHLADEELAAYLATYDLTTMRQRPPETWTPAQAAAVEKCQQGRDKEALVNALNGISWACDLEHEDELVDRLVELLDAHGLAARFCRLAQQSAAPGGRAWAG